jgi:muramoyltetrapeptide carboxypeptidase
MLTQMKLAGCFDDMAGMILGAFKECGQLNEIVNIFNSIFEDTNIPILAGFDIGHGKHNLTIPMGMGATLDADNKQLLFHEPATVA